ncbi:hypothetical protein MMC06_005433 [Schaereria dolodes]|nr:hypothetical protein [Schaereria dolodes]
MLTYEPLSQERHATSVKIGPETRVVSAKNRKMSTSVGTAWNIFPDFYVCDAAYGTSLSSLQCYLSLMQLDHGAHPIPYSVLARPQDTVPFSLPINAMQDRCSISVEVAGPARGQSVYLIPDTVRTIAQGLITTCVLGDRIGGFATINFSNLLDYVIEPTTDHAPGSAFLIPLAIKTQFVTVSVTGSFGRLLSPGDTDPKIPLNIAAALTQAGISATEVLANAPDSSSVQVAYMDDGMQWLQVTNGMSRIGKNAWWRLMPAGPSTTPSLA